MILTIMRHGEAGSAVSDRDRALTPRGSKDVARGADRLRQLCLERGLPAPSRLLHSAWLRTTETARIAADQLQPMTPQSWSPLLPGATVVEVEEGLESLLPEPHLLLISHQPLVSRLVWHLLGDRRVPAMSPAAFVTMQLPLAAADCPQLQFWALPPEYRTAT